MRALITNPVDDRSYVITKKLGKGGFADVYLGKSTVTGNVYAIKLIRKSSIKHDKQMDKVKSEIRLHNLCGLTDELSNKYICPFNKHWDDNQSIYILMKFCPHGSLQDWLHRRFNKYNEPIIEYEIRFIIKQVVMGVKYLHDRFSIIHRDLKLGNILLDESLNIKICDFGLATQLKQNESKKFTICGTPNFIAPEIATAIKGKRQKGEKNQGHSYEVDIWAIGVMIYTLFYGKPPFQTATIDDTVVKISNSEFSFPSKRRISGRLKHLIQNILTVDVELRLSSQGILKHLFFTDSKIPTKLPLCSLKRAPTEKELFPEQFDNDNDSNNNKENSFMDNSLLLRREFNKKIVNLVAYVDQSAKYGIAYILSNGSTGVFLNNQTSLLLACDKRRFFYIIHGDGDDDDEIKLYDYKTFGKDTINDYALNRAYKLFQAFAKQLWSQYKGDENEFVIDPNDLQKNNISYVKRHRNTKHAMIFQINSNIINSIFNNGTRIVISTKNSRKTAKIIVFKEDVDNKKKLGSLTEYDSAQDFNEKAPKEIIDCAIHIQKTISS